MTVVIGFLSWHLTISVLFLLLLSIIHRAVKAKFLFTVVFILQWIKINVFSNLFVLCKFETIH